MNKKERLENFRSSCMAYPQEKQELEKNRNITIINPAQKQFFRYMQEDVAYVESSFGRLQEQCGTNAELLIWMLFVERKTQSAITAEWKLSRKHIQYAADRWLRILLEDRQPDYKDHLFAFKSSCLMYRQEKEIRSQTKSIPDDKPILKKTFQMIRSDAAFTETVFTKLTEKYGKKAADLTAEVLINKRTQAEVAKENSMTKRKLEYNMNKWIRFSLQPDTGSH